MDLALIALVALVAALVTLYSGFGLGTTLLPVFALFFPPTIAVAATAMVHVLNNLFKAGLTWRAVDWGVAWRFGLPAAPAAIAGAWLLSRLDGAAPLFSVEAYGIRLDPTPAGLTIGLVLIAFAGLEIWPRFQRLQAPPRFLPLGGVLSGFFGGLSGHQGALRSMFLLKTGLGPAAFVATGAALAVLVDLVRLPVYLASLAAAGEDFDARALQAVGVAVLAAFAGSWLGARLLPKATLALVRLSVAALMALIGTAMALGVIGG
jgi:uncharacterized membrane protein YfcA